MSEHIDVDLANFRISAKHLIEQHNLSVKELKRELKSL